MKKRYTYITILVCLILLIAASVHTGLFKKISEPERMTSDFYDWYLGNVYLKNQPKTSPPDVPVESLNSKGVYYIDSTKNIAFLKNTGYFSDKYFAQETKKYDACSKDLAKVDVNKVAQSGGFASDFVDSGSCLFLSGFPWVGGMGEAVDSASVINSEIKGDNATVVVALKIQGKIYSYATVNLDKENEKWLITNISISYTKPIHG